MRLRERIGWAIGSHGVKAALETEVGNKMRYSSKVEKQGDSSTETKNFSRDSDGAQTEKRKNSHPTGETVNIGAGEEFGAPPKLGGGLRQVEEVCTYRG